MSSTEHSPEEERPTPEPVESPDGDLGGKAWFHNKPLVLGGIGIVVGLAAWLTYTTAQQAEIDREPTPERSPGGLLENIEVVPGDAPTVDVIGRRASPSNSSELTADQVFSQPRREPEPDPPPERPTRIEQPLPGDDEPPTVQDFITDDRDETPQGVDEVELRRRQLALDSFTAPTAPRSNSAWSAYWPAAEAFRNDERQRREALEAARLEAEAQEAAVEDEAEPSALWEGTVIHARMDRALRSDADLPLTAFVTRDVFDDLESWRVAVPRGTVILGLINGIKWNRIHGNWRAIILPDGRRIPINAALAAGGEGEGGVKGRLHTGMFRRLGLGLGAALISYAAQAGAEEPKLVCEPIESDEDDGESLGRCRPVYSPESRAREEAGREVTDITRRELEMMGDRHIPYVSVKPGVNVLAVLRDDLRF